MIERKREKLSASWGVPHQSNPMDTYLLAFLQTKDTPKCMCHTNDTVIILTFLQDVSYHLQLTCIGAVFSVRKWRGLD